MMKKTLSAVIGLSALMLTAFNAQAGFKTISVEVNVKNVCKEYLDNGVGIGGKGFSSCNIFSYDINDTKSRIEISPVIAKFETEGDGYEQNFDYAKADQVKQSDWSFTDQNGVISANPEDQTSGNWSFNNSLVSIRFWAAKAGSDYFNLFWNVSTDDATDYQSIENNVNNRGNGISDYDQYCQSGYFTLACLNAALNTSSGEWSTPINGGSNKAGLSNIVFFNSKDATVRTNDIPEPSTIAILGLGLVGLVLGRRKAR